MSASVGASDFSVLGCWIKGKADLRGGVAWIAWNLSEDDRAKKQAVLVELFGRLEALFTVNPLKDDFGELFEQTSTDDF